MGLILGLSVGGAGGGNCSLARAPEGAAPLEEVLDRERFERTKIAGQLIQPMEFEIAPDGRIFLIELGGTLKLIDPQTGQTTVAGKLNVTTEQENGLIGLALDPEFRTNSWLYLQYSPPDFPGQRISRFAFVDGQLDLSSEKILMSYEEQRRECCHHAGSMEFGPDGNLYIGTGDNTNPFNDSEGYAPIDQRQGREPWDAQRTSGNSRSYNGKILRIRPEPDGTYSIPDGNLFPRDGSVGHPEIYVMGCRNPWRISVDPRTGYLYWGDVGPDAGGDGPRGPRGYDEVNQARVAGNFGWPYFIGDNFAYSIVDFSTGEIRSPLDPQRPENRSPSNTGVAELPPAQPAMIYYPGGPSERFPAVGTGGRTACAGPVYYFDPQLASEVKFPRAYDATLFAFDWSRSAIWAVHLDDQSEVLAIEPFLPEMKFVRPIDMQFGAQGALYLLEYGETWGVNPDAQLVRIDYVRGNRTPVAVAEAEKSVGREPLELRLSAKKSMDKDRDPLTYRWSIVRSATESEPLTIETSETELTVSIDEPGIYTAILRVLDPGGAEGTTSLPVIVGNARPEVAFIEPRDGDFFEPGEEISYQVVVRDQEDGTSDPDEAEEGPLAFIEGTAPSRLFVEAVSVTRAEAEEQNAPPGLVLIRQSDCLNCHAAQRALVGPSFLEIAGKYRDQPHALEQSVQRVMQGSTGVWGKVGMIPHTQHTPAQVQQMVEYVYSVTAGSSNPIASGFRNSIAVPQLAGLVRMVATYTDLGRGEIPKLSGEGSILLRPRRIQAEAADEYRGTMPLGSSRAEGERFMGAIDHDGFLRFREVQLADLGAISVRVASNGAGGRIEIRQGSFDGPVIGKADVEVNGDWEAFYEKRIPVNPTAPRSDLFVVFQNQTNRGGLMNVDSLTFEKRSEEAEAN